MYKLIVSDLDGTLLNAEHRLGVATLTTLHEMRRLGVELVLASGRHDQDIRALAAPLGGDCGLISSNGAAVHDRHGRMTHWRAIDPDCLDFLLRDPVFARVHINAYRIDDWLVAKAEPRLLGYHQESGFAYRVVDFARLDATPVLKVFYYSEDRAHLASLQRLILERHGDRLAITYSLPAVLEVMAKGVSKGEALAGVVARRGLAAGDVIAFGDGCNDLEMLRYAGKGVLVANAVPELKSALPELEVIGSNEQEAVAVYLRRWLRASGFADPAGRDAVLDR